MSICFTVNMMNETIQGQYDFEQFEDGFRVVTRFGEKVAFSSINKIQFEKFYQKYWNTIVVNCEKEIYQNKVIFFNEEELSYLKQQIILHWMYFYAINNMKVLIKQSDLDHAQTWDLVRWFSQKKYRKGSPEADIVAANTIGIELTRYIQWRESRELFESLR